MSKVVVFLLVLTTIFRYCWPIYSHLPFKVSTNQRAGIGGSNLICLRPSRLWLIVTNLDTSDLMAESSILILIYVSKTPIGSPEVVSSLSGICTVAAPPTWSVLYRSVPRRFILERSRPIADRTAAVPAGTRGPIC